MKIEWITSNHPYNQDETLPESYPNGFIPAIGDHVGSVKAEYRVTERYVTQDLIQIHVLVVYHEG